MISAKWFKVWKLYMDEHLGNNANVEIQAPEQNTLVQYPGPIFNDDIIIFKKNLFINPNDEIGICKNQLKSNMVQNKDYMIVPNDIWKIWKNIYGGLDIPRLAIIEEKYEIEVFLQRINLLFLPPLIYAPKDLGVYYTTKNDILKNIVEFAKKLCNKNTNEELVLRLWKITIDDLERLKQTKWKIYERPGKHLEIEGELLNDESMILKNINIDDNIVILVELKPGGRDYIFTDIKEVYHSSEMINIAISNWQEYINLEDNKFSKIPFKALVNPGTCKCGRTGLYNLGNTCYMNSALQCLSNCQELTKYFLLELYKCEINLLNSFGEKGKLANEYAELLNSMWKGHCNKISPRQIKKSISEKAEQFQGRSQQDCQEFIHYFLDILGEDLCRVVNKPYMTIEVDDKIPETELSKELWDYHLARNHSIITDFFFGQLKSSLVCSQCNYKSLSFDPFIVLSINIPTFIEIEVLFFPLSMDKSIMKMKMMITQNIPIREISNRMKNQLALPHTSDIVCAIVNEGRIICKPSPESSYNELPKVGILCAYEYSIKSLSKEYYSLEVRYRISSKNVSPFNYPIIFNLPIESNYIEIQRSILEYFHYLPDTPRKTEVSNKIGVFDPNSSENSLFKLDRINDTELKDLMQNEEVKEECLLLRSLTKDNDIQLNKFKENRLIYNLTFFDKNNQSQFNIILNYYKKIYSLKETREKVINLYDCLDSYNMEEKLDNTNKWYCIKGETNVDATKKM